MNQSNETEKLPVVVVGCGGMSRAWIRIAVESPSIDVVGLVDLNRDNAVARAKEAELPESAVYDSLKQAVEATGAKAVFDVTVPAAHAPVTIEALELGCHVLGEKPMSDELEPAQRMVAKARETGLVYAVTQTRRPHDGLQSAIKTIRSGQIGDLEEVHCDFFIGAPFRGFRGEMRHPLILDMAIHTFDKGRLFCDADPVSVFCDSWNPGHSWYAGDASAIASFVMKRADGKQLRFTYRGSWTNDGMQTDWNSDWRLVGQRGTLKWNGGSGIEGQRRKNAGDPRDNRELEPVPIEKVELESHGHRYLINEFAQHILSGRQTPLSCPCEDNIKSLAMVVAAVESADTGKRVQVQW